MTEVLIGAFSFMGGAGIVGGVVGGVILRRIDRMSRTLDKQEQARIDESVVIIQGLKAIGHLSEATAIAQRDGKTNGEMKTALEYYQKSRDGLNGYLLKNSAERTHGRN